MQKENIAILYFSIYRKIKLRRKFTINGYLLIFYKQKYSCSLIFRLRSITQANVILDANTNQVANNAKDIVSNSNSGSKITRIGWLSKLGTGKLYGLLMIYLINKNQAEAFFEKGVI